MASDVTSFIIINILISNCHLMTHFFTVTGTDWNKLHFTSCPPVIPTCVITWPRLNVLHLSHCLTLSVWMKPWVFSSIPLCQITFFTCSEHFTMFVFLVFPLALDIDTFLIYTIKMFYLFLLVFLTWLHQQNHICLLFTFVFCKCFKMFDLLMFRLKMHVNQYTMTTAWHH